MFRMFAISRLFFPAHVCSVMIIANIVLVMTSHHSMHVKLLGLGFSYSSIHFILNLNFTVKVSIRERTTKCQLVCSGCVVLCSIVSNFMYSRHTESLTIYSIDTLHLAYSLFMHVYNTSSSIHSFKNHSFELSKANLRKIL